MICLGSLSLVAIGASSASANAEGPHGTATVTVIDHATNKNPRCGQFDGDETWIEVTKFEGNDGGTQGGVTVTFTTPDKVFNWTSALEITAVVVKSGSGGHHLYEYDPHAHLGTGLTTPGSTQAVSHISFCAATPDTLFDLVIHKAMAGTDRPDAPWSIDFAVDCDGTEFDQTVTVTDEDVAGDKGVFDIRDGVSCTVTESADHADDFDSTEVAVDGGTAVEATSVDVDMDDDHTVTFTNTRNDIEPEPWDLSVTKDVRGTDAPETWSFDFDVECGEGEGAISETITLTNDTDTGGVDDVPAGVSCTVTETAASSAGFVVSHSSNGQTYTAGSSATGTDQDPDVFFRNTRNVIITTTTTTTPTTTPTTTTPTTAPPEVGPTEFGPFPNSPDPIFQEVDEPEILPDTLVKTPPTVLGEVFTKAPAAAVLARTGTSSSALAAFAAILILLGIVMLVPFRRRELQA